ncbi:unnamed protein product [Mytilus coruscus]|uniref:Uncharacterized protein n=1 Tax=Mytilus coruscus TaxID=42192 RepID=A0A6J8EMP7_MYTCO|nr:unnamed protein product [Mytilus coruscus]
MTPKRQAAIAVGKSDRKVKAPPEKRIKRDLDVLKIHALLEEETRGHYKVNYIITEAGRILELQYDNKFNINMGDFKLIKKFRLFDEKISLPSHGMCFDSAPFSLVDFQDIIGNFKSPPIVEVSHVSSIPVNTRVCVRGEISRVDISPASVASSKTSIYIK